MNKISPWKNAWSKIYQMKLGERLAPSNNHSIVRVPGGWIYGSMQGEAFIPLCNEFNHN